MIVDHKLGCVVAAAFVLVAVLLPQASCLSKDDIKRLCSNFPNSTITIGMITRGNTELVMKRWRPTFETYLTAHLKLYGCQTRLVPLQFETYEDQTKNGSIEFIFPNPTAFQELKDKYGIHEFISVKRNFGAGQELDRFGGVIVRAANRHTNIISTEDILQYGSNLTVCAVNANAFGGWHIQWYEMLQVGVDVSTHFKEIKFLGDHDKPMLGLITGDCDIGIARTETVERLILEKRVGGSDLFTIGDRSKALGFPQNITTVLYPEWPLASLKHVPREFEQLVAVPLLTMTRTTPEAVLGDHAGFAFPYSYQPVRDLFLAIDHYGTGECEKGFGRETAFPRQCKACPAGFYNDDGRSGCLPCPVGFFTNATASMDCRFCPNGLTTLQTGSTPDQCVSPPASAEGSIVSSDTWINMGVGGVAAVAVLGTMMYMKRRTKSLLRALETVTRSTLPNVAAFWLELSDLVSDVVCALGLLAVTLDGISQELVFVYVICVSAHIIPSGYNLGVRGLNLVQTLKLGHQAARIDDSPRASQNASASSKQDGLLKPHGHTTAVDGKLTTAVSDESEEAASPTSQASTDTSGTELPGASAETKSPMHAVLRTLANETSFLEHALSKARIKQRGMIALLLGLLFEDLCMSVVNCTVFWIAKDYEQARTHQLFGVLGLAAASSLANLGFKVARLEHWLLRDRPESAQNAARLRLVQDLVPKLQHVETLDSALAGELVTALKTYDSGESWLQKRMSARVTTSRVSSMRPWSNRSMRMSTSRGDVAQIGHSGEEVDEQVYTVEGVDVMQPIRERQNGLSASEEGAVEGSAPAAHAESTPV